jgi:hypothetical protein
METTTYNVDDLYNEISDVAREQGVSNQHMWREMASDIVEDHLALGEIDVDEDTESMKENLFAMWEEYKLENGIGDEKNMFDEEEEN